MKKFQSKAYVVLIAGFVLSLVLGVLYSWSVMSKALQEQWQWTSSEASFPYALALGLFALSMAFAGPIQDKVGPKVVAAIGGAVCGLGLVVASFGSAGNSLPIILGFGALTGLGVGTAYSAATPAAIKWFGQPRKGLVTGIVVCGFGLSSAYLAPLTTWLLGLLGIAGTFRALGIAFMVVGIISALFIENPPKDYVAPPVEQKKARPHASPAVVADLSTKQIIKTPRFYAIWAAYACATFAGLMIMGHLVKIAEMQLAMSFGFLFVIAIALGNAAGRLISGVMIDRIGAFKTMLIIFLGQAIAMVLIGFTTSVVPLIILTALIGAFYGSNLAVFPAVVAGAYGTKYFGANYGLIFTAFGIGGVFGSLVASNIYDATGSYQLAFYIAAGLCVIAALLAPIAGRPASTKE